MISALSGPACENFLVSGNIIENKLISPQAVTRIPEGGGGYSHMWAIRVCAAQQGMLFASLTLEQGIKITLSLWKRVYFTLGLTLEQGRFFPET